MDKSNVLDSGFLERMNTLLANTEVPGLFEGDEHAALMTACKEGSQRDGLMLDSHEELYCWFTQQVAKNLHIVFTTNLPENGLASRVATLLITLLITSLSHMESFQSLYIARPSSTLLFTSIYHYIKSINGLVDVRVNTIMLPLVTTYVCESNIIVFLPCWPATPVSITTSIFIMKNKTSWKNSSATCTLIWTNLKTLWPRSRSCARAWLSNVLHCNLNLRNVIDSFFPMIFSLQIVYLPFCCHINILRLLFDDRYQ